MRWKVIGVAELRWTVVLTVMSVMKLDVDFVALTCAGSTSLKLRGCRRESEIGRVWKDTLG